MTPSLAQFAPLVGECFRICPEGAAELSARLIEARALGGAGQPGFALLFQGPAEPQLPQHSYAFRHARLGRLELFVVPVARHASGVQYEAIFN